jgi:nucleotide-binding universal stress UspA family protein
MTNDRQTMRSQPGRANEDYVMKGYRTPGVLGGSRKGTARLRKPTPKTAGSGLVSRTPPAAPIRLKRILVPVDFSRASIKPLNYAAALANAHGARIVVLHVTKPIAFCVDCGYGPVNRTEADSEQVNKDRARLSRFAVRHLSPRSIENLVIRSGNAGEQILAAAKEMGADLILLYAHEANPSSLVGSHETAERVTRSAPCPVLVVRPREQDFIDEAENGADLVE